MVVGRVVSDGRNLSSARFTVSVRVDTKSFRSNGFLGADMRRCFRAKRGRVQASFNGHHRPIVPKMAGFYDVLPCSKSFKHLLFGCYGTYPASFSLCFQTEKRI